VQPPRKGRLHASDLGQAGNLLTGLPAVPAGPAVVVPTRAAVVVPTRAAVVVPTGATVVVPAAVVVVVPIALTVPVIPVVRFAVEVEVIVATAPVEVVTPARVPELPGTPVVVRKRGHRLGLSDARRANAGKSKTRDDGSRSCDLFDVYHSFLVPLGAVQPNP
jgi:hypothetical protein